MRQLLFLFAISAMVLFAQDAPARGGGRGRGPQTPPKNLKVLTPEELAGGAMRNAATGLGVMCTACHVEDRSSDEIPMKLTARMMFGMVKEINSKFPDGKVHVTCYTCHRGAQKLLSESTLAADTEFFWRHGYLIVRNAFSREEMEVARAAIETNERMQRQLGNIRAKTES